MWKRQDESESEAAVESPAPAASASPTVAPKVMPDRPAGSTPAAIGQSVVVTGDLAGEEDLLIQGKVDGTIVARQHVVTIGEQATVSAKVTAREVVVLGKVEGNITASQRVEIRSSGTVEGDVTSPAVAIADGAQFRGAIDMSRETHARQGAAAKTAQASTVQSAAAPSAVSATVGKTIPAPVSRTPALAAQE